MDPTSADDRLGLPADGAGLLGADPLGQALARWAADAVVDEAARRRARDRWLRIQAEEEATLAGTLLDLAEHARPVVLDIGEHRLRGVLAGVGADFVALRSDRGQHVLVRISAVDVVRAEPGGHDVRGDRAITVEVGLDSVMGPLAADRPDVAVRTRTGTLVRGRLTRAGVDVVRLRVDGDPPAPTWVPLDAIAVLTIEP